MKLPSETSAAPPTRVVLNVLVLGTLVLCGPALTIIFLSSLSIDSQWPFRERDLVNGIAAVVVAAWCLVLAIRVGTVRMRGSAAAFTTWGSAGVLVISGTYCACFGAGFLELGSTCQDPYCMYEIAQVWWWILWAVTWAAVVVLLLVAAVTRTARPS